MATCDHIHIHIFFFSFWFFSCLFWRKRKYRRKYIFLFYRCSLYAMAVILRFLKNVEAHFLKFVYFILCLTWLCGLWLWYKKVMHKMVEWIIFIDWIHKVLWKPLIEFILINFFYQRSIEVLHTQGVNGSIDPLIVSMYLFSLQCTKHVTS